MYLTRIQIEDSPDDIQKFQNRFDGQEEWTEPFIPNELETSVPIKHFFSLDHVDGHTYLSILNEIDTDHTKRRVNSMSTGYLSAANRDLLINLLNDLGPLYNFKVSSLQSLSQLDDAGTEKKGEPTWLKNLSEKNGFVILKQMLPEQSESFLEEDFGNNRPVMALAKEHQVDASRSTFIGKLMVKDVKSFAKMILNGSSVRDNSDVGMITLIPDI